MESFDIAQTIEDFVHCARLAALAGYDGVEVVGSEGYLINRFVAPRTNTRTDEWGGSAENRIRFPVELVKAIRQALGPGFMLMYRMSALDLVDGGCTAEELDALARGVEQTGADVLNTGYGWHEASVPTIAYPVPRAAFTFACARIRKVVGIPVVASNRINTPEVAEEVLASGEADLVSVARPLPLRSLRAEGDRTPPRGHQRVHRLQPGLARLHLPREGRDVPGQPASLP